MNTTDKKTLFVEMRARGKSYSTIAKELQISKSTCTKWNYDLENAVENLKSEIFAELYEKYQMGRQARIERYGREIEKIDEALAKVDYSQVDPVKLHELKIRYLALLNNEYREPLSLTEAMS